MNLPSTGEVSAALAAARAPATPAECHGLLCGLLCAGAAEPALTWVRHALDDESAAAPPPPLNRLFSETRRQLDDPDLAFELLLPPDDVALGERAAALAAWCSGFGFGVGASDRGGGGALPADSAEFLQDVTEIARLGGSAEPGGEVDELAYTEICEYLRVGAMLMHAECAVAEPDPSPR